MLLASARIPAEFQPVYVEAEANGRRFQEMHVDGGIHGPMYVAPESYLVPPARGRLPMTQLYLVLNGAVATEFSPPSRMKGTILARTFAIALQFAAHLDLSLFYQAALRDNVEFHLAMSDTPLDVKARGAFDPDYMKALYERGFAHGKENRFLTRPPPRR